MAILEGRDFEKRFVLVRRFDRMIEENLRNGGVVISVGIAQFYPATDANCGAVLKRADSKMYERKKELKKLETSLRS